ncbi:hypothetical protein ACL02T_12950 [Pseudonocardia sp. RS010]|uniref:hypothetical protein n=1 Tax=Pseudonocardia sp. RS010 TaxID=3385979 RepID=UPI0039A02E98
MNLIPSHVDPSTGLSVSRDPITGRDVMHVPELDPAYRRENARNAVPSVFGGLTVQTLTAIKDRERALALLDTYGIERPRTVTDALEVYRAVSSVRVDAPAPRIAGLTATEAVDALDTYADTLARQDATKRAKDLLVAQAADEVIAAFGACVDDVLPSLSDRFDTEARVFVEAYETVKDCGSIADAAVLDQSGNGVKDWHRARNSAEEMNKIADILLAFGLPGLKPRGADAVDGGYTVTIAGDIGSGDVSEFFHLTDSARKGAVSTDLPFGLYPVTLRSGVPLMLPESTDDWDDRRQTYWAASQDFGMGLFR